MHTHLYSTMGNMQYLMRQDKLNELTESTDINASGLEYIRRWSIEEEENLIQAYKEHGSNWKLVCKKYFPWRTVSALHCKWSKLKKERGNTFLTLNDIEALKGIQEEDIERVPALKSSSQKQISRRWTKEEDEELMKLVQQYGKRWVKISHLFHGKKSFVQISKRYSNHLDPTITTTRFTPEENQILLKTLQKFGEDWEKIRESMPERSLTKIQDHIRDSVFFQKNWKSQSQDSSENSTPDQVNTELKGNRAKVSETIWDGNRRDSYRYRKFKSERRLHAA
ncbi:hypothetical protein G9A89_007257 [Geosiphon pyriformis]|nr:hypothetical protein G9A89_007257 [Geosiphon pyriformis]